jgi:hypothetical protein
MKLFPKRGWVLSLFLVVLPGDMRAGPITITDTVAPLGPLFQYNYTIANTSGDDLAVLDIAVTPGISITGLTTPAGFSDAYDPILGLVSFLENSSAFGPAPISGFIFDSSLAPLPTTFNGTLLDSNFNVVTIGGSTTGPVVPEPGYMLLLVFAVPLFLQRHGRPRLSNSNRQTSGQKEDLV